MHCTDEFLVACRNLAREYDVGVQMHVAESRGQAVIGVKKYGKTLTAHLDDLGLLGPRFTAAHGVWLDRDDMKRLGDAGGSVAHNPPSNVRLGSGVAATRLMLDAGDRVGVGTDSPSSSDTQNMFEAPGYRADIVLLDLTRPDFVPLNDALLQLVFSEAGAAVDTVMIDGRVVLDHGRLLTVDEAKVRVAAEAAAARLREANTGLVAAARALEEFEHRPGEAGAVANVGGLGGRPEPP